MRSAPSRRGPLGTRGTPSRSPTGDHGDLRDSVGGPIDVPSVGGRCAWGPGTPGDQGDPSRIGGPRGAVFNPQANCVNVVLTQSIACVLPHHLRTWGPEDLEICNGARGGWAPPGKIWAPPSRPRLPALTFYRYRYWGLFPPWNSVSPPY